MINVPRPPISVQKGPIKARPLLAQPLEMPKTSRGDKGKMDLLNQEADALIKKADETLRLLNQAFQKAQADVKKLSALPQEKSKTGDTRLNPLPLPKKAAHSAQIRKKALLKRASFI